jgi:hypothetical protein
MKGFANWLQEIMLGSDVANDNGVLLFVNAGEDTVVWRNEILILAADEDGAAFRAHAGIHDDHMDAARREIGISGGNGQSAIEQVERGDLVGDIDDLRLRIDLQDYAFEHADEMVVGAVVGGQGNDWIGQKSLPLQKLKRLLGTGVGRHPIVMTLTEDAAGCKESGGKRCKSANGGVWSSARLLFSATCQEFAFSVGNMIDINYGDNFVAFQIYPLLQEERGKLCSIKNHRENWKSLQLQGQILKRWKF